MDMTIPETRLAENERMFRRTNEQVVEGIASVKSIAKETNQQSVLGKIDNVVLYFRCECKNEKCQHRIPISVGEYERLHKNKQRFVVLAGHQDVRIERVVLAVREFVVVEKRKPLSNGKATGKESR